MEDYYCDGQISLFQKPRFKIDKPIRLIELFAGVGSQAMALKRIGADFERYRVVEFDKYAINSYNAIHGTDFPVLDITEISGDDLGICDRDKYCYILFYSFPCTDLSVAGTMKGMEEGSGTRSSLLWEVKRLLEETKELPQVLIMENVPQVHSKQNIGSFVKWIEFLNHKGYSTVWKDLNAKDFGVAQSRNRCFAVSMLGDYDYEFPKPFPLTKVMKDYLEDEVEEKYYLNNEKAKKLIDSLILNGKIITDTKKSEIEYSGNIRNQNQGFVGSVYSDNGVSPTIRARDYKDPVLVKDVDKLGGGVETVDLCLKNPRAINRANCIKARVDDGISNLQADGSGVAKWQKIEC